MTKLNIIRVKITDATGVWFASSPLTVKTCNKRAQARGINATYELATEEQYWAYKDAQKAVIAGSKVAA